jgi:hypothetical protein
MKKLVLVALLCLFIVPTLVSAQADWDLSQEVWVESLGIRFNAPDGWVVSSTDAATYVAETQEDIDTLGDGDASTNPAGIAIAVAGLPLEGSPMEDATLEDLANTLATQANAEVAGSGELQVNIRPAYYFIGTGTNEAGFTATSYVALWKQGSTLVVFGINSPEEAVNDDLSLAFGIMLGSMRPLVSEDFVAADDRYEVTDLGYTINYPADWTTADTAEIIGASGAVFAENADDIGAEVAAGTMITILQIPGSIEDLELGEDSEVEDYVTAFATLLGIENVESQGEFMVNGEWGVGFTGNSSTSGRPGLGIVTYSEEDEAFNVYIVATADDETLATYIPIFEALLWSIQPVEE